MTISKFEKAGDGESVTMLTQILAEEVTHVSAGMRWFREICAADNSSETIIEVRNQRLDRYIQKSTRLGLGLHTQASPPIPPHRQRFHQLVRQHFHGSLKPPFNEKLRTEAGFTPEWYEPLVHGT